MAVIRALAPLAFCLLGQPAAADCAMLQRIQSFSPLIDTVLLNPKSPAVVELDDTIRRFNVPALQSAFEASGHIELLDPIAHYLYAVRSLARTPASHSEVSSISRGRAFVDEAVATLCGERLATEAAQLADSRPSRGARRTLALLSAGAGVALAAAGALVLLVRPKVRRQRAQRLPCRYPTKLIANGQTFPCIAVDLSATGCKITVPSDLPKVREVKIVLDGQEFSAAIAWRQQFFAGLRVFPGVPEGLVDAGKTAVARPGRAAA